MTELECIKRACKKFKKLVSVKGPDGKPGLLNKYEANDFIKVITDNLTEYREEILTHPFFEALHVKNISEIYEDSEALFMYCLQVFLNKKMGEFTITTDLSTSDSTSIGIGTITDTTDSTINLEKENKKEFIKEVLDGVPRKKSLKEFFDDIESYKQYRDDVDQCLLYMDWEKIHRVMKKLKWKWCRWEDEFCEIHENTVPSVYGIRENVIRKIKDMENWISEHPDEDSYYTSSGGFQVEMYICNDLDLDDDYVNQVRFKVQFVVEEYDNGM